MRVCASGLGPFLDCPRIWEPQIIRRALRFPASVLGRQRDPLSASTRLWGSDRDLRASAAMARGVYLDSGRFATGGCARPFAFADRLRKPAVREHVELDRRSDGG